MSEVFAVFETCVPFEFGDLIERMLVFDDMPVEDCGGEEDASFGSALLVVWGCADALERVLDPAD